MAEPMNPLAGASGPGKFSARQDLPPSKEYGERKQMQEIMQGAPTSKTRGSADPKLGRPRSAPAVPLFADSQRPDEPITTGIDRGAGLGSEALGMNSMEDEDTNFRANIAAYMPVLTYISDLPDTSPETRKVIRQLRDSL
jgi:hypothetical protein